MNNKLLTYSEASAQFSIEEKVGQFFMPAAFINDTEEEIRKIETLIKKHHIGGVCFFHSRASAATNYEGKKEVLYNANSFEVLKNLIERYQSVAKIPLLISIDAEWGLAMRVENTPQYPYAVTLGAINNREDLIEKVGHCIALNCKAAGIHWNFTPVADINNNPENPVIGYRSFGSDKQNVSQKAAALARGLQSQGILNCAKHFPGHGDTATDSHLGLPRIDKSKAELLENELVPFQKLIEEGIDAVMIGHLSLPAIAGEGIPATISPIIIKDLLRNDLGFDGVVVTDALNMHAVSKMFPEKGELEWRAFEAGNDVLCFSENPKEGIQKIIRNAEANLIEESFKRIWELKLKSGVSKAPPTATLTAAGDLNGTLAKHALSLLNGTKSDLEHFRSQDFIGIEFSRIEGNTFFKVLQDHMKFQLISSASLSPENLSQQLAYEKPILLAIYPPKAKPQQNFGFTESEMDLLHALLKNKQIVLYLFGNPYFLNSIALTDIKALVLAFEKFEEFQVTAAAHFLGKHEAIGKMPVSLNKK